MTDLPKFNIAVLAGDGIGPEVMQPCIEILDIVCKNVGGFELSYTHIEAGAGYYQKSGESISQTALSQARQADAILLAAMGLPDVRYQDGTEISPQIELREKLNLYAGVRPIKTMPGLTPVLSDKRAEDLDFVLIRESTEGLFAARNTGVVERDEVALDTMKITRATSERLFDFSFRLAQRRKSQGKTGRLTCVDKANVISGFAFFRKIFDERAVSFPDIATDYSYVDAMGLNFIKRPWEFDVLVTENMFGDILSDVGAALMGGMGMAPSADIGDTHAVFQPCHGSAPDIAGQGKANPTAMFLSASMMLDWLGDQHNCQACIDASKQLTDAIENTYREGCVPYELGGSNGTKDITNAVITQLQRQ
ncbi:isocitrate/isopropylmalate dehydrogenase family protein [Agarilytica rhodophyticola]|uniref:isocitrate/isopropylmalate dehydrogenase family protein n=1 Tax=Agarilytica rhodophyticola TaxID=1737490 RepID=UPI000B3416C0|nr:isocitrate/isopropylmalate dehydrogenase family protein [Agarilytica rhodophyticola]